MNAATEMHNSNFTQIIQSNVHTYDFVSIPKLDINKSARDVRQTY
jgi:hypothetical protein